jgi:hypothetical protein
MQIRNIVQAHSGLIMIAISKVATEYPVTYASRLQSWIYDGYEKVSVLDEKSNLVDTKEYDQYLPALRKIAEEVRTLVKKDTDFRIGGAIYSQVFLLTEKEREQLSKYIGQDI